jgi:hypothetical protein
MLESFDELFECVYFEVIEESFDNLHIRKIDNQIKYLEDLYRLKDKVRFRKELKDVKKDFIAKLVKENFKSLRSKYFPNLKVNQKELDSIFRRNFYNDVENWQDFDQEKFSSFISEVEDIINYYSEINNGEFDGLRLISGKYMKY